MTAQIPESHRDLLEGPILVTLTTLGPDGAPENSVVWCSLDGDTVLVNTTEGRRKSANVRRDPRVALLALDPENWGRWIDVRGEVVEIISDTGAAHIAELAGIYTGKPYYYGNVAPAKMEGKEERIIFRIQPRKIAKIAY